MRLLITGSSGFVGSRVVELAEEKGWHCTQVRRSMPDLSPNEHKNLVIVSDISSQTDWSGKLENIDCIVHCAARVHQMDETVQEAQTAYREVNTMGTLNLARQAAEAGVKRFVFLSSIKVNGEFTESGKPFRPVLGSSPNDPYGKSKYEAEVGLHQIEDETGLEIVIIRPPLVYGPGVTANFLSMIKWVEKGIPLPLGAVNNKRSMVYLDNLVELILICCKSERAPGHTFLVSDNHDISVTELLIKIAEAMNKPKRLVPVPVPVLKLAGKMTGKSDVARRLCSNLQLDIKATMDTLDWAPPVSFCLGLQKTVDYYLHSVNCKSGG